MLGVVQPGLGGWVLAFMDMGGAGGEVWLRGVVWGWGWVERRMVDKVAAHGVGLGSGR